MASTGTQTTASIARVWLLAFSLLAATSNTSFSAVPPDQTLAPTLGVLDTAIRLLSRPAADYRKVLLDAIAALPSSADDTVRADIRTFLARAPEPGDDFRCDVDFVRSRARHALLRLRDRLRHEYLTPLEPAVCSASPVAVALMRVQKTGSRLDVYGYDFDQVATGMIVITSDGYRDVTSALVVQSHYHLTLNLGTDGAALSSDGVALGLTWGHLIHYSIPILRPTSLLCSARIETIPAGRTISYSTPPINGDRSFGRTPKDVWADVVLDYSSNKLEATLCVTTLDRQGHEAGFSGCTVEFVYTTEPDRVIDALFGESASDVSFADNRTGERYTGRPKSPVNLWAFAGFQQSGFDGRAVLTARLNEIRLVSRQGDGCVSPMVYLHARRTTALDLPTRQALDRKLKLVDPAILKLESAPRSAVKTNRY
jgi:hypothetical protein